MLPSPQRGYHERTSNNQQLARRIARLSPARRALLEQRLLGSRKPAAPVRAVPKAPSGDCPLTHVQRQVWAFERLYPGTPAYNVIWVKALHGPIDFPALERAFNALLGRHAILRATFHSTPDGPVQRIQPPAPAPLQHLFVEAGAADSQAAAREIARGEADRAFDLERGPLARATLIRVTVEEHWLLLTAHHLVADGWSMGVAERDLAELYNGFRQAREPNLPSLPIEYADWAAWLSTHETDTAYWVNELDGASHEPGLHTDFARTPNSLPAGVNPAEAWKAGVTVPRPLLAALESTARACDATVYALLIAAWAAVLHRHGCGEDLMIGTPLAGRTRPDLANVVGFFANTLPLRIGIQGDPTFAGLVARVKQKVLAAVDRQDAPVTPGFQTAVAYLESHPSQHLFSGLRTEHLLLDNRSAPFDTMLFADQFAGQLALTVALRKHIFGESTCITIARHLERFLEGIATDPGLPVSAYPLMDAEERRAVLALSGGNTRPYSREPVHVLFERQAALTPESVALVDGGRTVTYAELGRHSTHIAAAIAQAGVGPGSIVAVLCDGSSAMVAAFLGVMKAGAAYLPLDIADPQLRLRQLVREANARLVLTPGCERFPGVDTLLLNQLPEAKTVPPAEITPDSPAYVMYTSGSTGVPKAVVVPHRGIGRLVRECSFARLDPSTVCLHMAPPAFDASTFEIWAPLLNGGLCVLYSGSRASLADIGDAIRLHGVNTLWLTSSLFNAVIDEAPQMLAPIRQLLIGGEVLSVPHVTKALRALPATRIVNGYGPTECTTFACCYPIPHDIDPNSASIPIGTPIASTSAYILDGRGEPVPLGVPGELYLGGDGVALGYLGQPELTNEVFLPDPFHPGTHHIYKTGDRARWLPSGVIEFLGRADGQLKIRGFRVEPGEVEAALLALPSIAQAAVAVQDGSSGAKHLIAYVVPSAQAGTGRGALEAGRNSPPQLRCAGEDLGGSGQADSESIRAALSHRLPAYMVPARIAIIDRLPLRDNGKIDRARLPAIQHTR
ncbi:MAG: amino acid adenylation domain-containing protein, partial [Bryobacteraceae bacterium]